MSLTSSLQRIVSAKESIRQAIESKGVTVASSVGIADYPSYIGAITGGGASCVLLSKVITANGVYSAVDDNADGYSEVTVSVPTGGGGGAFDIDAWANKTMSEIDDTNGVIKGIGGTAVGYYPACSYQSMLTSINLPSCSRIVDFGFAYCSSLSYVSIPNLTYLGNFVFSGCVSLPTSITLDNCEYIGTNAFYNTPVTSLVAPKCSYLGQSVISYRNTNYISVSEICNINSSCGAYSNRYTAGTNIYCDYLSINGVSRFALYSIRWNSATCSVDTNCRVLCQNMSGYATGALRTLDLRNVVAIGSSAFKQCGNSMKSTLSIYGSQVVYCGESTFINTSNSGMYSLQSINFPKLSILPSYFTSGASMYLKTVTTSALVSIGYFALYNTTKLTAINISPDCYYIGSDALGYASLINNPLRLDHLSYLGNEAFIKTSIVYANISTLSSLNQKAFCNCSYLSYAKFKDVAIVYSSAVAGCSKMARCYFLSNSVATLSNINVFTTTPMSDSTYLGDFGSIYVPYSLLNGYKTATNWATYSNRFTGLYEFTIGGIKYWGGVGSTYTQWVDDAIDNEDGFVVNGTSLYTSDGTKYVVGMDLTSAIEDGATFTLADV